MTCLSVLDEYMPNPQGTRDYFATRASLGDERDITVRGLNAVQKCDLIFLEEYTSVLRVDKTKLEEFYGRPIKVADRNCVESEADLILQPAKNGLNVALLVVGDPVCATTHTDLMIRARAEGISVELIHNASIMGAVGACGLQLYNFGQTVSIPFFEDTWRPTSFYSKIKYNKDGGMHTLCLLDIKVKEPDYDAMVRGKTVYLPPRFMEVNTAAKQLLEAEEIHGECACTKDCLAVGLARLGHQDQCIIAGTLEELISQDFGEPLHSLIICGDTHDLEMEMLNQFMIADSRYRIQNSVETESV